VQRHALGEDIQTKPGNFRQRLPQRCLRGSRSTEAAEAFSWTVGTIEHAEAATSPFQVSSFQIDKGAFAGHCISFQFNFLPVLIRY
jgi:hypothetical protein